MELEVLMDADGPMEQLRSPEQVVEIKADAQNISSCFESFSRGIGHPVNLERLWLGNESRSLGSIPLLGLGDERLEENYVPGSTDSQVPERSLELPGDTF